MTMTTSPPPTPAAGPGGDPQPVPPARGDGPARRPSPVPRDPSAARPPAAPLRRRAAPVRPVPPPPAPLARYHAQLLARRRLRALAAVTGGLGSAALLALGSATVPTAGAVPAAADDVLDPRAWVLPEDAGMGPLVIPTIGALPAGAEDWFLPGAPAAAVTSLRQAARPAARDLDADLEAELGLVSDPGPSAAPASRTT
ncbi:hypothetical protein E9564_07725, partial [Blastococcus sp. MG754427]|uniref:hypothetical protein n=1 Tax=Blastococcus sp. MG754427 TaxID=2570318 RepID=UPI001F4347FF